MKKMILISLGLVLVLSLAGAGFAADPQAPAKEQTVCPVMGGHAVNPNLSADYKGQKYYFCCPPCREKFIADPEKYLHTQLPRSW